MERNFKGIWIPKEIWLDENLTMMEKIFLVEIDSLDNENGCFASNNYFADFFGISASRASQVINALSKKEYVDIAYDRDPNTQEIRQRVVNTRIKYFKGGIKYSKGGYLENAKDNNTLINNTTNIKHSVESSSTPSSKLFSSPKSNSRKVKSWIDKKLNLIDEYDFSEEVKDCLADFFTTLGEMNALLADTTVRAQLNNLIQKIPSDSRKCQVIRDTISRGWKSLDYMIDDTLKGKGKNGFDTAKNSTNQFYSEEQKQKLRQQLNNVPEEDIF